MAISIYPDEPSKRAFWFFTELPVSPPEVELYGTWYALSVDPVKKAGVLLLCGSEITSPAPGHVKITGDYLPRVKADGEIHTDEWIRLRRR